MTSALAMHDHLLRALLHQHCGYEASADCCELAAQLLLALNCCACLSEVTSNQLDVLHNIVLTDLADACICH